MKAVVCAAIGATILIGAIWFSAGTSAGPQKRVRIQSHTAKDSRSANHLLSDLSDGTIGNAMRRLAPDQIGASITFPAATSESPAQLLSLDDDYGSGKFWLGNAEGKVSLPKRGEVHLALANSESEAYNLLTAIETRGIHVVEIPLECLSDRVVLAAANVPGAYGIKIYGGQLNQDLVRKLATFPTLTSLVLMNVAADQTTFQRILDLKNLRQLKCIGMTISDPFMDGLKTLPNIQDIDFDDCKLPANATEKLSSIKTLQVLSLANAGITNKDCIALSNATSLNTLGLARNEISDAGVRYLAKIKNLQCLTLKFTQVSDASVTTFSALRNLSRLDVSYTNVTDEITYELSRTNISKFCLEGTAITDAGARNFRDCKLLANLVLDDTAVGDAEISEIQRRHPLAKIQ